MLAVHLDIANDMGGGLGMAGIEDPAHLLIVLNEAVGLIDQQRRADILDVAEQVRSREMLLANSERGVR